MSVQLTIGTAVYNVGEPFLREHIEGVMRQLTDETELLLIDDCSTDNSGEICREYAEKDERVRYIRLDHNSWLSTVRNRTIAEAQGKWILFADGDDLLSDHCVETFLRFCPRYNEAAYDIVIHDRLKFVGQKQPEQPCTLTDVTELPPEAGRALSVSCLCLDPTLGQALGLSPLAFYHAAWAAVYRREFLVQNELLFPVKQKKAQDSVFNTQAYFHAEKIAWLPYVMYYYRTNEQGITKRYSRDFPQMAQSLIEHLKACEESQFPGDDDVTARFIQHRVGSLLLDNMRLNLFHHDNPKPRKERKREFLAFIAGEPYQTALRSFDPQTSGRWEWHLPMRLAQKKCFALLDLLMRDPKLDQKLCGADKRLTKLFKMQ